MKLRDYQTKAIQDAKLAFRQGHKHICICLSVGAGKSLICKEIIESGTKKNSKLGFFSFRTSLVEQIKTYFNDLPNIDIGTLQKFGKNETELYDLAIFDEKDFHGAKSKNNIKSKYSITLSGTPTDEKGNVLEFDHIVQGVQLPDLVEMGYAKQIKVMSIATVDTSGLKKQGADFHKGQSFELMSKAQVKKDLVDTYKRYCIGRKTLLFAIDTNHAEQLKEEFLSNGIKCDTIHSKKKNDGILESFENGEFDLIINVAMISVGVDVPSINTILFARPMASIPLFIQCVGRATRKHKDDYCLILDCAEVLKRTNHHPMQKLDFTKKQIKREFKKCQCGGELETIEKQIKDKTDLSYTLVTYKRCKTCKEVAIQEDFKVIELIQCDECLKPIDKNIEMSMKDKKLEFVYKCSCGFEKVQREIILSQAELKEIEYNEIMQTETWERVKKMLLASCKRCGYNHRYSVRLIEYMQDRGISIQDAISAIEDLDSKGHKISKLMYGYFS